MSLYILCVIVVAFYAVIWFFDSFFKSCMHYPYYAFLEGTGLKVGLFYFSWVTTAFNRVIFVWGRALSRILKNWFTVGCLVTIGIFLPFSLFTLISMISDNFFVKVPSPDGIQVQAMLPGVNIPASEFGVYFIAIGLSSVIHEMGHALAAVQNDVPLLEMGVYVFTIIPMAFVKFNNDLILSLSVGKRLKIYCAGIWHNIVVAVLALLLYFITPVLFSFAYTTDTGVRILRFEDNSPLNYERGLNIGDTVTSINGCDIKNTKDWSYCLQRAYDKYGICTDANFVAENDMSFTETIHENGFVECCHKEEKYHLCFEFMQDETVNTNTQYTCLKPRDMIATNFIKCTKKDHYRCPKSHHCLRPALDNHTSLIIIKKTDNTHVLYLGTPYEVHKTVIVDQYIAKFPIFSHFTPSKLETFLRYVFTFSLGLGFLNVLPCYGTDGHYIAKSLIQLLSAYYKKNDEFVNLVSAVTTVIGTFITVPTLVYLFYKAISLGQ